MAIWLDLTLKASILVGLAGVVTGLMRRASAASRHLVWTGAFVAVVLLPVARLALPAIQVAVLAPDAPLITPSAPVDPVADRAFSSATVAGELRPVFPQVSGTIAPVDRPWARMWRPDQVFAAVWVLVTALLGLRVILGFVSTWRLGRGAQTVSDRELLARLDQIRLNLRVHRPVRLLISSNQRMPVTWGVVRPVILLPSSVAAWTVDAPARLDSVLAHEAAHIARWDSVPQLITRLGVAMFWFNPLMWIASRQARFERERACDDAVLALGTRPSDYAGHLVTVARSLPAASTVAGAAGLAMARRSHLDRRVRAILDERVNRRGVSRASLALTSALVAVMLPASAISLTARQAAVAPIPVVTAVATPAAPRPASAPVPYVMKVSTPRPARSVPDAIGPLPEPIPVEIQAAPFPQVPAGGFSAATWREDRAALLLQLRDKARQYHQDSLKKVEIGTMASIETLTAETTIVNLEAAFAADKNVGWFYVPSERELVNLSRAFEVALRNLSAEEARMAAGTTTGRNLSTALMFAVNVLLIPSPPTDAALVVALRQIATIASETDRMNALVALAERNSLSPDTVALYVEVAKGIVSDTGRARVFAQPIHVRP